MRSSSRLNGLNPQFIKFLSFVILGVCVAVAALIKVSRLSSINYSVIAKDIEMDAILAVALGGNALSGGKFNMAASIMGLCDPVPYDNPVQIQRTVRCALRVQGSRCHCSGCAECAEGSREAGRSWKKIKTAGKGGWLR